MSKDLIFLKLPALIALILAYLIIVPNTYAVTKSLSPTPTLTITPTPTTLPDTKIDEIRQAIKDKVSQIKDKLEKRAFVGIVKEITGNTIVITNYIGQQRLTTDETTVYLASNKKEVLIKDLAVGDKVIALGTLNTESELQTIRIFVVAPDKNPAPPQRLVLIGQTMSVDLAKSTLSFANEGKNASTNSYKIDKNSKYSLSLGDKLTTINPKTLSINRRALLVYYINNKIPTIKSLFYLD